MTVTTTHLTRAAGISAAIAGAIFVAVQIKHPPMTVDTVETTQWLIRSSAKMVMAALALAGITGMYLRQVREMGKLGLAGYLVFSIGYLLMFATETIGTFVLPNLASSNPQFVNDVVVKAFGNTPTGSIGSMSAFIAISGLFYLGGGVLFGTALFRARVLARWAAGLLTVSTAALAALAVLPDSFNRPMAVPVGVALIGLGVSLWRDQWTSSGSGSQRSTRSATIERATV